MGALLQLEPPLGPPPVSLPVLVTAAPPAGFDFAAPVSALMSTVFAASDATT